jgi:phosphoglycolate phosphatase-like HAD superfamily hydrolase
VRRFAIFLDDGGVMNDNAVRGSQWQRLVAEFFAPRLGGDPAAWAEANKVVATELFQGYVRECFAGPLYGPDVVNTPKEGPRYYTRIFADAGVDPCDAIVVDDFPDALAWARAAGARTAWVRSERGVARDADLALGGLRDLPAALDNLAAGEWRPAAGGTR